MGLVSRFGRERNKHMTSDNYLFIFIILLLFATIYGIVTNKVTAEERDQMLDSEDMFP
jgi:hypothetical protein